ncbi:MAG TPA: nitrate reductase molybdenum cofactor assembly chaperone [Acidimicrobiales bacterium]|nr:nitrate reductase molybdenum cofactor assembly chaperone [Acidimicrobiales bacterium]
MRRPAAARIYGCAAVLLSYPDASFTADLAAVARAVAALPAGRARTGLEATTEWLSQMTPMQAATAYVDTFDLKRGTSLYLTYYRHGDTRERGMALAALGDCYRASGFQLAPGELPDFLPALLELAACDRAGAAILAEQRVGLDALAAALDQAGSPYHPAVIAVIDALPGPSRADRAALERYRSQGPPSEQVGLEPFAPPEILGDKVARR